MMMVEETTLPEHLHKLIGVKCEQKLENLLQLLWQTRKIGLSNSQKSSIHSLLDLPSPRDLDPVLACLRSLIWNCVNRNIESDDDLKLFPADLPVELHSMLLVLLQKLRSHWKEELPPQPHASGWTRSSHHVNVGLSAPLLPCSSSAVSGSLLSLQVDPASHSSGPNIGGLIPITAERNVPCFPQLTLQNDIGPTEILRVFPRLKSMTWTVENKGEMQTNRVAIITLKLQDYTKSPLNEMEVKFQLTRDTLEAVLRSMTYISDQLSQSILFEAVTEETKAMMTCLSMTISNCISTEAAVLKEPMWSFTASKAAATILYPPQNPCPLPPPEASLPATANATSEGDSVWLRCKQLSVSVSISISISVAMGLAYIALNNL